MPVYTYQGVDHKGRRFSGQMPAVSEMQLEEKLTKTGIWLLDAQQHSVASKAASESGANWLGGSIRRRDIIEFCTLMAFQTKVGLSLVQALEVASQDCENPKLRKVLAGLQRHLESGFLLHEALEKYPKVFDAHFTSVIRAADMSSKLPEAFTDLRDYLEWVDRVLADVRQASLYPAIVTLVVLGFTIGLFMFVIPKFAALLNSVNVELPLMTQLVFGLSDFVRQTWWLWVVLLPFSAMSLFLARRYSKRVAIAFDRVKLQLPIFGELNMMLAMSRFAHNLAILYRSGIPLLQALKLCQGLIGNAVVEDAVGEVEEGLKGGSTMSEAMRKQPVFPPLLLRMALMGETTGNLDHALDNVAEYYSDIIPRRIKKVLTVMEPMLMLFLIGLVGCVALAIYLPILSLMDTIGK